MRKRTMTTKNDPNERSLEIPNGPGPDNVDQPQSTDATSENTSNEPVPEDEPKAPIPEEPTPKEPKIELPTPGRIVNYFPTKGDGLRGYGSNSWPAIVTEVHDETICLQVFSKYTVVPKQNVPAVDKKNDEVGHWEWPVRK